MTFLLRWFTILALLVLITMLGGCSTFGIASEEYVESRVSAVDEKMTEAAVEVAAPVDSVVPGYSAFVRGAYTNRHVAPPPPPDPSSEWLPIVSMALTLLGVPTAVGVTNHMRDKRRRTLNEATNVPEAAAKGYFVPDQRTPGGVA